MEMYLRIFIIPPWKLSKFVRKIPYVSGIIPFLNRRLYQGSIGKDIVSSCWNYKKLGLACQGNIDLRRSGEVSLFVGGRELCLLRIDKLQKVTELLAAKYTRAAI